MRTGFLLIALTVLAFRIHHCSRLPANTGDLLRHVYYGLAVNDPGLEAANVPLNELAPSLQHVSWSHVPFNYPVLSLLFDAGVAKLSPTLFAYKCTLTLLEALIAFLIVVLTKDRLLGLVYWVSPASIWWVSREGQFEPLHNLFTIIALILLCRKHWSAWPVLALAIQTKVFAFFLLPLFFVQARKAGTLRESCIFFAVGFLPTLLLLNVVDVGNIAHSASLRFNPYYWNFFDGGMFAWMPQGLLLICQLASAAWFFLALIMLMKERSAQYTAPLGFLAGLKLSTNAQFWYVNALSMFLLPIEKKRLRMLLMLAVPLLDPYSILQLIHGPFGYVTGGGYEGMTAFTRLALPI